MKINLFLILNIKQGLLRKYRKNLMKKSSGYRRLRIKYHASGP